MQWPRKIFDGIAYYHSGNTNSNADNNTSPIVFIHGVGLRAESWYRQFMAFDDSYRCYAIDMPGHGKSDLLSFGTLQLDDFARVAVHFIERVVGEPAIIVGHSLGAMTALQTAVAYPQTVRGVAALNAIYNRPDDAAQAVRARAESLLNNLNQNVADSPIARWFNSESDGKDRYLADAELCRTWLNNGNRLGYARAYQMFAYLRGIAKTDLQSITVPTLLLTGELDFNSSPEMSQAMAEILPNARVVIIPEARHMTQMTHADAVNQALAIFFTACDSQTIMTS